MFHKHVACTLKFLFTHIIMMHIILQPSSKRISLFQSRPQSGIQPRTYDVASWSYTLIQNDCCEWWGYSSLKMAVTALLFWLKRSKTQFELSLQWNMGHMFFKGSTKKGKKKRYKRKKRINKISEKYVPWREKE